MLDKDTKVIQGISANGKETYINAKYWNGYEEKDVKTIGGYSIFKKSDSDDGNIVIHTDSIIEITYSDLKDLREKSGLIPGIQYRITDYVTTTSQAETRSAENQFDIIVTADGVNTLNERCRACLHNNDNYFSDCNLESWEIKYCLDNDNNRFAWVDNINGKGVIYYMKDEFNNECWYDFKNILFLRSASWFSENPNFPTQFSEDKYFYTFSAVSEKGEIIDDRLLSFRTFSI
jgi:hypothetical protein